MTKITAVTAALMLVSAACGPETNETWDEPYEVTGPVQTANKSIYLNQTLEEIQVVEPAREDGDATIDVTTASTGEDPTQMKLSADGSELYVLESGDDSLSIFDLTASPPSRESVSLDSTYDRMTVDPEGEFLLLSFAGDASSDCIACNLNEVGVVDLRDSAPEEARFVTLPKRAQNLVFAPKFSLGGGEQRLVAALSPSQVSLLDLEALAEGDQKNDVREVPLTVSQAEEVKNPEDAVFHVATSGDDDGDSSSKRVSLYLLTEGGNDVTQVSIQPSRTQNADRKFDLSVNQLAAGDNPSAMTILDLPEVGTRLLTLDSRRARFQLIDVESAEGSSFELPMTAPAQEMLVYNTVVSNGDEETNETRVLAWSKRSELVSVIRPASLSISNDDPTVGRSVEAIRLEGVPTNVRMEESTERERAVALHSGSQAGFSVLDLKAGANNATFIKGASLNDLQFSGSVAFGVFSGRANFGEFDLETGHPTTFELPNPGENIVYDGDDDVVMIDHAKQHGEFTVLDASDPKRKNAKVYQGVFIRDLFQKEFPSEE